MLSYLRRRTVDEDRIIVEKSVTATENKTCMTGRYIYQMCLVLHQKLLWNLMESCYCKQPEVYSFETQHISSLITRLVILLTCDLLNLFGLNL